VPTPSFASVRGCHAGSLVVFGGAVVVVVVVVAIALAFAGGEEAL
jgi:hypothetical protein